jgi:hypothetical protein
VPQPCVPMACRKSQSNPPTGYDGLARGMGRDPFYFGTQASVAAAAAGNGKNRFQLDASVLFCLWWYSERGMPTYALPPPPPHVR